MTHTSFPRILLCAVLIGALLHADESFPKPDWKDQPDPLASPLAEPGGEIVIFPGQSPKSFNYYLDNNSFSQQFFGLMYETLLSRDSITLDYVPALADRWTVSDDKKVFTFHIDSKARWSDGKPVTAHDVKWTFETIMDEKHLTGVHKVALEAFETVEAVDDATVRFTAKYVHWRNLSAAGGLDILPRHVFQGKDFNLINFEFPVVSGPYALGEHEEKVQVVLKRREDWWQRQRKSTLGSYNFAAIRFRFYGERENAFEAFRRGDVDLYAVYTSRIWVKQTDGEAFRKHWIVKQKISNYNPVGFQGFAMNSRRAPFDDVRIRKAMALLLDREKMNERLMHSQYFLHKSYYENLYDPEHPCPNTVVPFDPEAARALLREAGWTVNPKTGLLEKGGEPFRIKFLTRSASSDKFLAVYSQDLKAVGIELQSDRKDWAAWVRDMDTFNYQMTWAAWGSSIFADPEGMWHSDEATRESGNNITGFQSHRVDALIEKQRTEFDLEKRNEIVREIDRILFDAHPYALLWNIDYTRLLYWNKFGTPDWVLSKYGDERAAVAYWWYDPDAEADLKSARKDGAPLPERPAEIRFDDVFRSQ